PDSNIAPARPATLLASPAVHLVVATATTALGDALARPLVAAGHEGTHVRDGAPLAATLAQEPPPRAALVARRPPGGDALALVRGTSVPMVLVSPEETERDAAREARLAGFLTVPFQPSEVLACLGVSTRTKRVVLLADDSDLVHRHSGPILEEAGYEV